MAGQREPGWARPVVLPSSWSAATADAQGTAHCHMCFCVPCLHVLRFEGRNGNMSSFLLKFFRTKKRRRGRVATVDCSSGSILTSVLVPVGPAPGAELLVST